MKPEQKATPQEVPAGLVERVTFHNEENGFCVLKTKARGHRDLVTVVGQAASISTGEWITASGEWVNDRTHGQQFRAGFLKTSAPTSIEGIEKYLGSGMIRGIGPVYAKKLVRAFGEKVFDTIEPEPGRLREIEGIDPVRAKRIAGAWAEQKVVREIMMFLHSNGVGTARAVRIYKTYGSDAVRVMTRSDSRNNRLIRGPHQSGRLYKLVPDNRGVSEFDRRSYAQSRFELQGLRGDRPRLLDAPRERERRCLSHNECSETRIISRTNGPIHR